MKILIPLVIFICGIIGAVQFWKSGSPPLAALTFLTATWLAVQQLAINVIMETISFLMDVMEFIINGTDPTHTD